MLKKNYATEFTYNKTFLYANIWLCQFALSLCSFNPAACVLGEGDTFCLLATSFDVIYSVSQEEWTKLWESVPYVKIYRYNPKHLYPKLNVYGDNGHQKVWASGGSTFCTLSVTPYSSTAHARQQDIVMQ